MPLNQGEIAMFRESEKQVELSFDCRQLQVRDLTYALNNLTAAFHRGVNNFNITRNATIDRDEYVLRLLDVVVNRKVQIKATVAATRTAVEMASPEAVRMLRNDLVDEMFDELCNEEPGSRCAGFRIAMIRKAPRIENFKIRLIEKVPDVGEKIIKDKKWDAIPQTEQ